MPGGVETFTDRDGATRTLAESGWIEPQPLPEHFCGYDCVFRELFGDDYRERLGKCVLGITTAPYGMGHYYFQEIFGQVWAMFGGRAYLCDVLEVAGEKDGKWPLVIYKAWECIQRGEDPLPVIKQAVDLRNPKEVAFYTLFRAIYNIPVVQTLMSGSDEVKFEVDNMWQIPFVTRLFWRCLSGAYCQTVTKDLAPNMLLLVEQMKINALLAAHPIAVQALEGLIDMGMVADLSDGGYGREIGMPAILAVLSNKITHIVADANVARILRHVYGVGRDQVAVTGTPSEVLSEVQIEAKFNLDVNWVMFSTSGNGCGLHLVDKAIDELQAEMQGEPKPGQKKRAYVFFIGYQADWDRENDGVTVRQVLEKIDRLGLTNSRYLKVIVGGPEKVLFDSKDLISRLGQAIDICGSRTVAASIKNQYLREKVILEFAKGGEPVLNNYPRGVFTVATDCRGDNEVTNVWEMLKKGVIILSSWPKGRRGYWGKKGEVTEAMYGCIGQDNLPLGEYLDQIFANMLPQKALQNGRTYPDRTAIVAVGYSIANCLGRDPNKDSGWGRSFRQRMEEIAAGRWDADRQYLHTKYGF